MTHQLLNQHETDPNHSDPGAAAAAAAAGCAVVAVMLLQQGVCHSRVLMVQQHQRVQPHLLQPQQHLQPQH
jgi:hypothetical protein